MTVAFRETTRALLEDVKAVLAQYDHAITLRQLFYRLVAAHILDNTENAYKGLSKLLVRAREAGLVAVDALEDRTRAPFRDPCWPGLDDYAQVVREAYRRDKWASQAIHVEVWVEKDALAGVVGAVTQGYDIFAYACRGYNSMTALWEAEQRFEAQDKPVVVLYLGDFDPSGVDMTRDIRDRLAAYTEAEVTVRRVALTDAQIAEHDLPPMPAKRTDSRAAGFIAAHGEVSAVELDALPPDVLTALVEDAIGENCDLSEFARQQEIEAEERDEWRAHLARLDGEE